MTGREQAKRAEQSQPGETTRSSDKSDKMIITINCFVIPMELF